MGYRIDYTRDSQKRYGTGIRWKRVGALAAGCMVLFGLLVNLYWPVGAEKLRQVLIPGDAEVTSQALENMVDGLRTGENISDAITTFCRDILENAQIPD